jgi:S1-C subfamily serine protease
VYSESEEKSVRKLIAELVFVTGFCLACTAQVQSNALLRVFYMRVGNATGSAFTMEQNDRQYLVTAKHLISGLPPKGATVEIFQMADWHPLTVNILYCKSTDVDIVVLEIPKDVSPRFELEPDRNDVLVGQDVYFLGFPYGLHSVYSNGEYAPFVKHGVMSAFDSLDADTVVLYIDGFNNPGFSGGPIVYWDRSHGNKMKLLGVVSGYRQEQAKTKVGKTEVDTQILTNTGIVIGYSIEHAVKAIADSLVRHKD